MTKPPAVTVVKPRRPTLVAATELGDGSVLVVSDGRTRTLDRATFEQEFEPATADDLWASVSELAPPAPIALPTQTPRPQRTKRGRPAKRAVKKGATRKHRGRSRSSGPPRPGPVPRYDWAKGRRLWEDGKSGREIAAALGCSDASVYLRAKEEGWPKRETRRRARGRAQGVSKANGRRRIQAMSCPHCGHQTATDPCSGCHIRIPGSVDA